MTQIAPLGNPASTRLPPHELYLRVGVLVLVALLVYLAGYEGLHFRRWVWDTTAAIRFKSDIDRGFDWGRTAQAEGVLNQYEKMSVQKPADSNWLDYAPLRLEVMSLWAKRSAGQFPGVKHWSDQKSYELTEPLLSFTTETDLAGTVVAFSLVWWWARRGTRRDGGPGFYTGIAPGLVAAAILWFNPAVILDGYGWPSYDGWVIPFFLAAAFAASTGRWFSAGLAIGIGAMLKGQLLGATPVFAIWAVIAGSRAKVGGGRAAVVTLATPESDNAPGVAEATTAARSTDFKSDALSGNSISDTLRRGGLLDYIRRARPVLDHLLAVARLLGGVGVAIAVIASPWLLSSIPADRLAAARAVQMRPKMQAWQVPVGTFAIPRMINVGALVWVIGVAVLASVLPWARRWSTNRPGWHPHVRRVVGHRLFWRIVAVAVAFSWIVWPWCRPAGRGHLWTGILIAAAAAGLVFLSRPGRSLIQPVAIATAAAMLLCISIFNSSSAWWDCGFKFGTEHWPVLEVGPTDNVPALLTERFRWENTRLDEPAARFAPREYLHLLPRQGHVFSIGQLLRFVSGIGIVLAAIGIGIQARRRDPRVLIALVTPWIWFYCFTPQVQDRYLVFAAGSACVCAGISSGMTLLGIGLSIVATMSILQDMMWASRGSDIAAFQSGLGRQFPRLFEKTGPNLHRLVDGTHPDLAWAVTLVAMIFLYFSLAMRRRSGAAKVGRKVPQPAA